MLKRALLSGGIVLAALAFPVVVRAQEPEVNIDPHHHGNLAHAQEFIIDAWQMINRAQADNNDHLGGHAQKAKDLLREAMEELRLAADQANANEYHE